MSDWYEDHSNLVEMAGLMADAGAEAKHIVSFVAQPWKWTREWEDRDGHDDNWCNGILDCRRAECDHCHDRVPQCQIRTIELQWGPDDFSDLSLCPECRETEVWKQEVD